jgi:hypothetical protein
LRVDSYSSAFEKDMGVSVINHALVAPLAQLGVKCQDSSLFLIRESNLKKLTLVITNGDLVFEPAPGRAPGTERLHFAIEVSKKVASGK